MRPSDPSAVLTALRGVEPDLLDAELCAAAVAQVAVLRAWCDALQVRLVRRQRELAEQGAATAPRDTLARHGRQSSKDAKAADDREQVCATMPGFEDALASGSVAAGHLDAVANATRSLDDTARAEFAACAGDLLAEAERQSVDVFERTCRELARAVTAQATANDASELDAQRARANVKHWRDKQTGMWHTHLELDPVRDRTLWGAIRSSLGVLRRRDGNANAPWQQLEVDAVVHAASGPAGERVPEILVVVDEQTRCHGLHEHTICETSDGEPLPVSTVQRWCCDAEIAIVHLDGRREVLGVGRGQRTATRGQRRALRALHRTCAHPDCTVSFEDCRIHHVRFWRHGGATDIDNEIPLCEQHHHLVHEGGWTLTLGRGRVATWTRPDGTVHHTGPSADRVASNRTGRPRDLAPPVAMAG